LDELSQYVTINSEQLIHLSYLSEVEIIPAEMWWCSAGK